MFPYALALLIVSGNLHLLNVSMDGLSLGSTLPKNHSTTVRCMEIDNTVRRWNGMIVLSMACVFGLILHLVYYCITYHCSISVTASRLCELK